MTEAKIANRLFTRCDILKLTALSARQLQYWDETGLVRPRHKTIRRRYYDFTNLVELRLMERLLGDGLSTQKIRKFLVKLHKMLPRRQDVLSRLRIHTDGRTLILQEKGAYFDIDGQQKLFAFDASKLYRDVNRRNVGLVVDGWNRVVADRPGRILRKAV